MYRYNLTTVDNAEEKYFAIGGINGRFPMWFLSPDGHIRDLDNQALLPLQDFVTGTNQIPGAR